MQQNIEIAVRIKPCEDNITSSAYGWNSQQIQIGDRTPFTFDYVIDPQSSQQQVFEKIGHKIISNVLQGYNGCIFAYGQTGSGKTYTMTGYDSEEGIVQKSLRMLWNCVRKEQFYEFKLSYFQIYNETIRDLLSQKENLTVRQNSKYGFYVENITEKIVERFEEFQQLIVQGISTRTIKQTKMNNKSSRSHSILEVNVSYKSNHNGKLDVLRRAKVTFIDLAGSQKQKQTQVEGQRLKQAANINKSLSTLSLVISKLSQSSQKRTSQSSASNQPQIHIPFRNSVLTKILKNSLTGKSKIIIVCTISIEDRYIDQTSSTLRFAQLAKSIKLKVNKNQQEYDGARQKLFEEFKEWKKNFSELKDKFDQIDKENQLLRRENAVLKDQVQSKNQELSELRILVDCMRMETRNDRISQQIEYEHARMYKNSSQAHSQSQFSSYNRYRAQQNQGSQSQSQQHLWRHTLSSQQLKHQEPKPFQYPLAPASQLSFFTSNLSSQFNSPHKSFFTIQQADQKDENELSSFKQKSNRKIKKLQKELNEVKVRNEFLFLQKQLLQKQVQQLQKWRVFTRLNEQEIQQGHQRFKQLMSQKNFSHAQLKLLKLCIKKSYQDIEKIELLQQQKYNQKKRYNQIIETVQTTLMNYVQAGNCLGDNFINDEFFRPNSLFLNSPQKQWNYENAEQEKIENVSNEQVCMSEGKMREKKVDDHVSSKSKSSQNNLRRPNIPTQASQFNFNNYQHTQVSQSANNFMNPQQSQNHMFLSFDNRSLRSQTSNKLSTNELEYLKKDYERLQTQIKEFKDEVERRKIQAIEKDSLLQVKQFQIDEKSEQIRRLTDQLDTQLLIIQVQRKKTKDYVGSKQKEQTSRNQQRQIIKLNQELQETQKKLLNLEIEFNDKLKKIETIDKVLSEKNNQLDVAKNQIRKKDQTMQTIKAEIDEKTKLIGKMTTEMQQRQYQVLSLKYRLEEKDKSIEALESLLDQRQSQIQYMGKTLSQTSLELYQFQTQLSQAQNKLKQARKQLSQRDRRISQKQNQLSQNQKQLQQKATQINHLSQHLKKTQTQHETAVNSLKLKIKQQEIAIAKSSRRDSDYHYQIKEALQSLQNEEQIQRLRKQINELKQNAKNFQIINGRLNSQNQLLTEHYEHVMQYLTNNNLLNTKAISPPQTQQSNHCIRPFHLVNTQIPLYTKPPSLTQPQLFKAIQSHNQQYMYQAAYFYHKRCLHLQEQNQQYQQQIEQLKREYSHGIEDANNSKARIFDKYQEEKELRLKYYDLYLQEKEKGIKFQKQLGKKEQETDKMKKKVQDLVNYSKVLEEKMKEKQQKEFVYKQKINNIEASFSTNADNSQHDQRKYSQISQPSNLPISQNSLVRHSSKDIFKRRSSGASSTSSNQSLAMSPSPSIYTTRNYSKIVEMPRCQPQTSADDFQLFQPITQLENDNSSDVISKNDFENRCRLVKSSSSMISRTVTNPNARDYCEKSVLQSERNSQKDFWFGEDQKNVNNQVQSKQKEGKVGSLKTDSLAKCSNPKNWKGFASKK